MGPLGIPKGRQSGDQKQRNRETLSESPPMGSTALGMFIITIYSNTILIPLL
jgi:hypothetical protein